MKFDLKAEIAIAFFVISVGEEIMLKDPYLNECFEPSLMWFIGVFDVYDREETRGVELGAYNPNESGDREVLIRKYCLNLPYLSYRHRLVLLEYLKVKLEDPTYDFQLLFEIDPCEAASWPRGEWDSLDNPRGFFLDIYKLAIEVWKLDLAKRLVKIVLHGSFGFIRKFNDGPKRVLR